jgi:hypothetical protein
MRVVFCDRPLSDDPHEQLVTQIRGAVAEYERTLIADRMRRGRLARLRSGQLLPWTRAPYGYRLHPQRPRDPAAVQIDPVAAVVVQELFAAYAAGGVTLHGLAAQLTPGGCRPRPASRSGGRRRSVDCSPTRPIGGRRPAAGCGRLRPAVASRRWSRSAGGEHHGASVHQVDHRPGPGAGLRRAVRAGRAAAGRQPAQRAAQHHPSVLAARAGQLRGLPLGPARGSPVLPATPGIATTAAWANRPRSAPAAQAAARRGSSLSASSTSWSGRTCARSCSSPSWSPRPWSAPTAAPGCPRSCIPSGLGSPACSAIVQQFLRGRSEGSPRTNALARHRRSARPNRPATRPSSSSSSPCQRAGSTSTLWPAATV